MSAEFWVGPHGAPDTFRLVSMLGGGGEGEVWQAVLPLSAGGRRTVAVKIMPGRGGTEEARNWDRFGHLLRSLTHPGLVRVTDLFTGPDMHRAGVPGEGHRLFVVMDHVDGQTLRDWVTDHPETRVAERLRMLRMIASALDVMHSGSTTEVPVAHGDVKPANIVVRDDRGTVLVDLGLARLADGAGVSGHSAPYAAPELRTRGALPTPDADRFAFAVTVAQVLTGVAPPLGPDGWLDVGGLDRALRGHPLTARRHRLVQQIMDAVVAPPGARPRELRRWLDAAVESLSQLTGEPEHASVAVAAVPAGVGARETATATAGTRPSGPAPAGPPPAGDRQPDRRRRRGPVTAAVALVVLAAGAVGVGALYEALPHGSTAPGAGGGSSAVAAPPAGDTNAPVVPVAATMYLSDHDPVETDVKAGVASYVLDTSAPLDGTRYGHTITMGSGCNGGDGGDYWIDYATDRQWSTFTTTAGLSDESSASTKGTWTLLGDGRPLASGTLALGQPTKVDVPVQGVLRLRLMMHDEGAMPDACFSGHKAVMVWGEPTLTR